MNRKIFFSLVSICSVVGMVSGSALAVFTSSASNNGNTFGAGNLVLNINGAAGATSSPVFTVGSIAPGYTTTQVITLSNTGSVAASSVVLTSIGHSGSTPDLGDKLSLQIYDDNGNGILDGGDVLRGSAHITDPAWSSINLGFGLAASGGSHQILAVVTFDSDADNSFQGTSSTFDLNFQANQ